MFNEKDQSVVSAIRALSIAMIDKANSGHPGLPLDAAPMAYVTWAKQMKQAPSDPKWPNRDRFILSAGHGSAMLYAMLHLAGFGLTMEDLKHFRSAESKTPGHPEYGLTAGVEATTGPLGQGLSNAVGMAMAEAHQAAFFNKEGYPIIDHYTYDLSGDGDLMEGVASEAASLAGHLKLGKLIVLYDSNNVSLDGSTNMAFTENVRQRFEAYGWQTLYVEDGNDMEAIQKAIEEAKKDKEHPSLIEIKTVIGYGSTLQGTSKVHGAALGVEESKATMHKLGWDYDAFEVPSEIYDHVKEEIVDPGEESMNEWKELFKRYEEAYPELAADFKRAYEGKLPENWDEALPSFKPEDGPKATRNLSQDVIQALSKTLPELWGGSADLSASTMTMIKSDTDYQAGHYEGRNIWFGVREHGMAGIANGIALHGGSRIYAGTFFVFSDYMRGAMRVSGISHLPVTYVLTHDSIGLGEDGPTHEPIEQLASFRAMPNIVVIRPADGNETTAAWKAAMLSEDHPTLLVLSRQKLPELKGSVDNQENILKGAYIVSPSEKEVPDGLLIATGSEVSLAIEAQAKLKEEDIDVRVVSMPSWELFEAQDESYQEEVLPKEVTKRMSIEAGSTLGWERYVGKEGLVYGITRFGMSGKGEEVMDLYGFSVDKVVAAYKNKFKN